MHPKIDHVYKTNLPNQRYIGKKLHVNTAADNFASLLMFFDIILGDYVFDILSNFLTVVHAFSSKMMARADVRI